MRAQQRRAERRLDFRDLIERARARALSVAPLRHGRHPAKPDLGFSYALTASLGARLLSKGNDFAQTDVASVLE